MNRFDYVRYDEMSGMQQQAFKILFTELEKHIEESLDDSRAKSLALTKLEEVYMWIGKAIRDDQFARNRVVQLEEKRSNS